MALQGGAWMSLLLLFVSTSIPWSCAQLTPATCGLQDAQLCSFFFDHLEDAFMGDPNIPYALQKAFFPVGKLSPLKMDVQTEIAINTVPDIGCTDDDFSFRSQDISSLPNISTLCSEYECTSRLYVFEHRWIRTILSFVIEREDLGFLEMVNIIAFAASVFNQIDFSRGEIEFPENISIVDQSDSMVQFSIRIQSLPCIPQTSVMLNAWEDILPWLQLYARSRSGIRLFDIEDRGYPVRTGNTAEIDDVNDVLEAGLLLPVLTGMHILMMTAIALIIMRFIITYSKETLTKSSNSAAVSIYWSNVFMSVLATLAIILGNLSLYGIGISFIKQTSSRAFTFRVTSDITTGVLILLEVVAAILTPKCTCSVHIPVLITHLVCCNRCCNFCAKKSRAKKLSWFVQTVALWVQMVLLQLAATSIIPVVVVCLRNPTPSIAFATLMVAVYFCLVIFIAHFLQLMRGGKDTETSRVTFSLLLQAFAFLVFLGIIACVVVVYLRFVQAGSGTSSVTGLILSLIPTIGISAVSWFAKKQLLSEEKGEYEVSNGNDDSQTGIAKYTARFIKTIRAAKQRLTSVPNGQSAIDTESHNSNDMEKVLLNIEPNASNGQSADDAESHNSDATEKVSLNIEPDVTATPHSTEIRFVTVDIQPTEPEDEVIANPAVVDTNI